MCKFSIPPQKMGKLRNKAMEKKIFIIHKPYLESLKSC